MNDLIFKHIGGEDPHIDRVKLIGFQGMIVGLIPHLTLPPFKEWGS